MMQLKPQYGRHLIGLGLALGLTLPAAAQAGDPHAGHRMAQPGRKPAGSMPKTADPHAGHRMPGTGAPGTPALPPLPETLPGWFENKSTNHIFYKRGPYNYDVYNIPALARDLNAVAVGHAMVYEDLVTGKADQLESKTFNRINRVLNHPPRFMPDEAAISPTFGRKYGMLEMMFDWTHILHAQTVDVLASTRLSEEEKDREIEALYRYYFDNVPWKITPLPMNMGYLDSQPYSKAFRREYPKVNGLFWGYHWLQGAMYDLLYGKSLEDQRAAYQVMGRQYHEVELYRTDRRFMPMFAEVSPRFARKFPHIANTFDNLHMLHDLINDILATEWMTKEQKEEQIRRAMWLVSADAHPGEQPGGVRQANSLHDHRFMPGMPGMGMMPEGVGHAGHGDHGAMGQPASGKPATAPNPHAGHQMPAGAAPAPDPHAGHRMPAPIKSKPARPAPSKGKTTKPAPAPKPEPGKHHHH